jgi:molecular chaperone DnaK (HSP70)
LSYSLGVDLGTTFSAAAVHRGDGSVIFPLGTDRAAIPSTVLFREEGEELIGEAAERRARAEPDRVAREYKRRFGDPTPMLVGGTPRTPESLTAKVLRQIIEQIETTEGAPPEEIVLTHPACWRDYKLSVMDQVLTLAQVPHGALVPEPVAAAVHYTQSERIPADARLVVYDLGGGTFDVAVLRRRDDTFEILGDPIGIERLGGIDLDIALLGIVDRVLGDRVDVHAASPREAAQVREEIVTARQALSHDLDVLVPVTLGGITHDVRVTRGEFEATIRPLLDETIAATWAALEECGVAVTDVHAILLVGGSTRTPLVGELVGKAFNRPVMVDANPKHAIALGAAHLAHLSSRAARVVEEPAPPQAEPPREPAPPVEPPMPEPTDDDVLRPQVAALAALIVLVGVVIALLIA